MGQPQSTQFVRQQSIHPRLKENDIRPECESGFEDTLHSIEISLILCSIGQVHVETATLFAKGEVIAPMNRDRQNIRIILEDLRRPIPLMHI